MSQWKFPNLQGTGNAKKVSGFHACMLATSQVPRFYPSALGCESCYPTAIAWVEIIKSALHAQFVLILRMNSVTNLHRQAIQNREE